jgi:hypothetical protein
MKALSMLARVGRAVLLSAAVATPVLTHAAHAFDAFGGDRGTRVSPCRARADRRAGARSE